MLTGATDGASLIYTSSALDTPLQSLVHASLGIHSLLKRSPLKHNVIDRDKIVVPPNWDSTSKIMILRDGFDVNAVGEGWSIDIDQEFLPPPPANGVKGGEDGTAEQSAPAVIPSRRPVVADPEGSAVVLYESQVQDSSLDALHLAQQTQDTTKLEVDGANTQEFLATLVPRLEQEKKADEEHGKELAQAASGTDEVISEHIGPVQFNMGGIQVDADDMVQRLKVRLPASFEDLLSDCNHRSAKHLSSPPNQAPWRTRRIAMLRSRWTPRDWRSSLET